MSRWICWRATGWALMKIGLGLAVLGLALRLTMSGKRLRGIFSELATTRRLRHWRGDGTFLQTGQPRLAIVAVSAVREGTPEEAEALTIRGLALASLEEVGPARVVLERAWRLRPNAMAAKVLAAIYLGANETDRGLHDAPCGGAPRPGRLPPLVRDGRRASTCGAAATKKPRLPSENP